MKKILIVDDLKPFIEQEKSILSRADFQIFTAGSAEEALELHREYKMDLIIADLEMPGMPGDELCEEIRQDPGLRKVSILMVCTRKKADIERCSKCGANSYIARPVKREELLERAKGLLEIPSRKDMRVLMKVSVKGRFKAEPFFCASQDVSKSGILFESDKVLAKGDVIQCSFFIPDEERVQTDGEVVRVSRSEPGVYCYGIRFVNIEPEYEFAIDRYIKKRAQSS